MTQYHVVVASEEIAYVWQYRTPVSKLTSLDQGTHSLRREGGSRERMFHIDDQGINEGDTIGKKITDFDTLNIRPTNDAMVRTKRRSSSCNYHWNRFHRSIPLLLSSHKSQLSNKPKQDY